MADDTSFGGFSSGDAAKTFGKVIAQIKEDMAAIEASAKNIETSLSKASKHSMGGGSKFGAQNSGGSTGFSKSAGGTSALGAITTQLGGWKGVATFGAGAAGAAMGGMGIGGSQGAIAGGIAVAGLPDLIMRPEQALDQEAAQFGVMQATGDFGSFNRMMKTAKNSFNVQNQEAFQNTIVYGTQRAGMVGLNGGGTVGERKAAMQIGGYNTLAGMAGIDQSAVPGMMSSMMGAQAYYSSMAAGVMTRNPVTGETIGIEGQANQLYNTSGLKGMNKQKALDQIDINYGVGSAGYAQLMEQYGNADAADSVVEALRIQAQQGGKPLKEGQVQDQAKESGILGTKDSQGMESTRALESAKTGLNLETLGAATAGIAEVNEHIATAVDYLAQLEGPLKKMLDGYITMANAMGTLQTELPSATTNLTNFFSGLPGLLTGLLLGGGGKGSLLGLAGRGLVAAAGTAIGGVALAGAGAAAAVGGVGLAGAWAVNRYTDYDEHHGAAANASTARNAGRGTPSSGSGYGTSSSSSSSSSSSGSTRAPTPTVNAGGYGSHSKGSWFVEADQDSRIHYGEMILPNRVAESVRRELDAGKSDRSTSKGATVNIYLTVQKASDQEAVHFANKVKRIIEGDRELMSIGAGRFA